MKTPILIVFLIGSFTRIELWAKELINTLIILKSNDIKLVKETIKSLEKEGCRISVITPPTIRGYVPPEKIEVLKKEKI